MIKETYAEMQKRQQAEVNAFPFGFAFDAKQFEDMMVNKFGLKIADIDKIYSIGAGTYIRKTDAKAMEEMFSRHKAENKELRKNLNEVYKMFLIQLGNHEYCISEDDEEVLAACSMTLEDLKDADIKKQWNKAVKMYLKKVNY